eukprot:15470521-Alexandrium_andersonii.AAC.1
MSATSSGPPAKVAPIADTSKSTFAGSSGRVASARTRRPTICATWNVGVENAGGLWRLREQVGERPEHLRHAG